MNSKINTLLQCNMDPNQGGLYGQDMRYAKEIMVSAEKLKGKRPTLHSCYRASEHISF